MKKITIIGWTRWFWEWLAKFIIKNFEDKIELTITWRNKETWEPLAQIMWANFSIDNLASVKEADVIIFSTPISHTEKIIKEVIPYVKNTSVVLDVTSIKWFPTEIMKKYAPKWTLIIPTHPMFWPFYNIIAGQIVVLTPEEEVKKDERYLTFKDFLSERGANVIETTPKEHDKMMAVVQWLTHYNMFVLWETIRRLDIDVEKSMSFVSPIYKIMMSSVSRYMWHDPKLYWDIQMFNKEVLDVHKVFMETSNDFNEFVKNKDEDWFIDMIKNASKHFWEKNTEVWKKYIDKTTYLISKQTKKVKTNIWKISEFENIYSWDIVKAKILDFDHTNIFLEDSEILDINEWEIK